MKCLMYLLIVLLAWSGPLSAQYTLPSDRAIAWEDNLAVNNPPPVWTATMDAVSDCGADDTGASDAAADITTCLASISANECVSLPAGTFRVDSSITIPQNKCLRGAGWSTVIQQNHTVNVFRLAGNSSAGTGNTYTLTGGLTKGSTDLTFSGCCSGWSVGDTIVITEDEDQVLTFTGDCTWCGDNTGDHILGQFVDIDAINGSVVTISAPLTYTFSSGNNPFGKEYNMRDRAGLENLRIYNPDSNFDSSPTIEIYSCKLCWVRGVEVENAYTTSVYTSWSYGTIVMDSYFHEATSYTAGRGYLLRAIRYNTDLYIVNNTLDKARYCIEIDGGGTGSIVAYNYCKNTVEGSSPGFMHPSISWHGGHVYMVLVEGNIVGQVSGDNVHGSSSHTVVFRTNCRRETDIDWETITNGELCVDWQINSRYNTVLGSVLGIDSIGGNYLVNGSGFNNLLRYGCNGASCGGHSDDAFDTRLVDGVYEAATPDTHWDSTEDTLPDSLYLSAKPAFFGSYTWPSIGPDLGSNVATMVLPLPAEDRYTHIVVDTDLTECNDAIDNDLDGLYDLSDPGCTSAADNDETNTSSGGGVIDTQSPIFDGLIVR